MTIPELYGNRLPGSARSRRQKQGEATGRVGMRQSFDLRTHRYMESPGVHHIVICIGPVFHVNADSRRNRDSPSIECGKTLPTSPRKSPWRSWTTCTVGVRPSSRWGNGTKGSGRSRNCMDRRFANRQRRPRRVLAKCNSRTGPSVAAERCTGTADRREGAELYRAPRCRPLSKTVSYLPCTQRMYIEVELLGREAGCRISLRRPGRRKTGTVIAPTAATCIATIKIYPSDHGFASRPVDKTFSYVFGHRC